VLKKAATKKEVDEFILSMTARRAGGAQARPIFEDAVKKMSFDGRSEDLKGGNTAATIISRPRPPRSSRTAFKPVVRQA